MVVVVVRGRVVEVYKCNKWVVVLGVHRFIGGYIKLSIFRANHNHLISHFHKQSHNLLYTLREQKIDEKAFHTFFALPLQFPSFIIIYPINTLSFLLPTLLQTLQPVIHLHKVQFSRLVLDLIHYLLQLLPTLFQAFYLVITHLLSHQLFDLLKNGLNRVQVVGSRRYVVEFDVFLHEHLSEARFTLCIISMNFIEIKYQIELPIFALYILAERTFLEVAKKFLDDLIKLLSMKETLLNMEKQNTMYSTSQENRNDVILIIRTIREAATQLIRKNQCLILFDKWQHKLCIIFTDCFIPCMRLNCSH